MQTLQAIAERLAVALLDLVTFPEESDRERLVDRTRFMAKGVVRRLLKETEPEKL